MIHKSSQFAHIMTMMTDSRRSVGLTVCNAICIECTATACHRIRMMRSQNVQNNWGDKNTFLICYGRLIGREWRFELDNMLT